MATSKKSTELTSYEEAKKKELELIQSSIATDKGVRITAANHKFNIPEMGKTEKLEAVIIGFIAVNRFYEGDFDKDNIVPPNCAANGEYKHAKRNYHQSLVPFDSVPKPESTSCEECPNNEFGSKGNGKACRNKYVLALVTPDSLDESEPVYTLDVPPGTIKEFEPYVASLKKLNASTLDVVTHISFNEDSTFNHFYFRVCDKKKGDNNDGMNPNAAQQWSLYNGIAEGILTSEPNFEVDEKSSKRSKKKASRRRAA